MLAYRDPLYDSLQSVTLCHEQEIFPYLSNPRHMYFVMSVTFG